MANVQKYFEQFHDKIRTDLEMNQTLREKKEIILRLLRRRLQEAGRPGFDELLQGSYSTPIRTGVKPIADLEYDIDIGLRFAFDETEYTAKEVRAWIFEAIDGHTDSVKEMGPCIRVGYSDGYHVDLVCYANWVDSVGVEQFRLAHRDNGWRPADPPKLLSHVKQARQRYEGTEDSKTKTDQLRRVVRYLKRWYDVAIPEDSDAKPTGLAFSLLAIEKLSPAYAYDGSPDDRSALRALAAASAAALGRIVAFKPTPEYEDMFGKLSEREMADLKNRFEEMKDALDQAAEETDPVKACEALQKVFGDDFPVPEPEDTARKTKAPAIVTSSSSA
ncbi:MAG: hypothetical protein K2X35_03515 [Bryobacteraceae bacterium]|nr:hypothetical protein [Bryobacteraceae bacterium]